jgi:hypothetical protein
MLFEREDAEANSKDVSRAQRASSEAASDIKRVLVHFHLISTPFMLESSSRALSAYIANFMHYLHELRPI